jgi:hypothetical protein
VVEERDDDESLLVWAAFLCSGLRRGAVWTSHHGRSATPCLTSTRLPSDITGVLVIPCLGDKDAPRGRISRESR